MTPDYGSAFAAWRADCPGPWTAYTRHAFVEGLRDGSLPQAAFLAYLRQDYLFLMQFARAWALVVVLGKRPTRASDSEARTARRLAKAASSWLFSAKA